MKKKRLHWLGVVLLLKLYVIPGYVEVIPEAF